MTKAIHDFQRSWRYVDGASSFILVYPALAASGTTTTLAYFSNQCGDRVDHYDDRDGEVRWKSR